MTAPDPLTPDESAAPATAGPSSVAAGQKKEERDAAANPLPASQLPAPSIDPPNQRAVAGKADMPLSVSPTPTNRLVGRFIEDLESDFTRSARVPAEDLPRDMVEAGLTDPTNGQLALHNLRIRKPEAYFRLLGQMIPKEMLVAADSDLGAMLQELHTRRAATIEGQRSAIDPRALQIDRSNSEQQRARVKKRWAKQGKGNIQRDEKGRIVKHIKSVLDEHGSDASSSEARGRRETSE